MRLTLTEREARVLVERALVVLRLGCGLVLGTAAVAKLASFAAFASFLDSLVPGPWWVAVVPALGIVAGELTATALLASSRWASKGGALAAMLGLGFLTYHSAGRGGASACPCFGPWLVLDEVSGTLIGLMLALGGTTLALDRNPKHHRLRPPADVHLPLAGVLAAGALALIVAVGGLTAVGTNRGHQGNAAPVARATEWVPVGEPVPNIPLTVGERLTDLPRITAGRACLVSFLSMGCSTCDAAVDLLQPALAERRDLRWVVVLPTATDAEHLADALRRIPELVVANSADGGDSPPTT